MYGMDIKPKDIVERVEEDKILLEGVNILDIIEFVAKKNRRFQRMLLDDVEEVIGKDSKEFLAIRKAILDYFNRYTRSILKIIFGNDFEDIIGR